MESNSSKAKAIELVKEAVELDNAGNYEEALRKYKMSLEYFSLCLKYEKNPHSKKTITEKARLREGECGRDCPRVRRRCRPAAALTRACAAVHRVPGARGGAAAARGVGGAHAAAAPTHPPPSLPAQDAGPAQTRAAARAHRQGQGQGRGGCRRLRGQGGAQRGRRDPHARRCSRD